MCRLRFPLFFVLILLGAGPTVAQNAVPSPAAIAVLSQSLTADGSATALSSIQDFSASGTITYFWAAQQVQGSATVLGRGSDQFRVDANLPAGTRSYVVSHGVGSLKDRSGGITSIPYHNSVNVGILTFPYFGVQARLATR